MSKSTIYGLKPNRRGIEALMKSPEMQRGLAEAAVDTAQRVSWAAARVAKTPPRLQPYKGHAKVLKYTAVGVVRPTTKQGRAIEAKYQLLELFGRR